MNADQSSQAEAQGKLVVRFEAQGTEYQGEVVSLADSSIQVCLESGLGRKLALPTEVRLAVGGGNLAEEFQAQGIVSGWKRQGEKDCLGIDLDEEQFAILESMAYPQRSDRTAVRGSKAIRVGIESFDESISVAAALVDLSDSGLAVILSCDDDFLLASSEAGNESSQPWRIRLGLKLPGNEEELKCVAELCYRMFTRKCVKYGLRFDLEATKELFSAEVSDILAHLESFRSDASKAA